MRFENKGGNAEVAEGDAESTEEGEDVTGAGEWMSASGVLGLWVTWGHAAAYFVRGE